jgi:hypothetical protein
METTVRSYGRSELAQQYFPELKQMSAWLKLKSLMLEYPELISLTHLSRRTFTPREVALLFDTLGTP